MHHTGASSVYMLLRLMWLLLGLVDMSVTKISVTLSHVYAHIRQESPRVDSLRRQSTPVDYRDSELSGRLGRSDRHV